VLVVIRVRHRPRDHWEFAWFVAVMSWSALRILVVSTWLGDYDVDPWRYAAVDLGSSAPYSLASARLLGALVDGRLRAAVPWGLLAVVTFVAPDVYILTAGRALPWGTYVVVGTIATVGAILAMQSGQAKVRERRLEPAMVEVPVSAR